MWPSSTSTCLRSRVSRVGSAAGIAAMAGTDDEADGVWADAPPPVVGGGIDDSRRRLCGSVPRATWAGPTSGLLGGRCGVRRSVGCSSLARNWASAPESNSSPARRASSNWKRPSAFCRSRPVW